MELSYSSSYNNETMSPADMEPKDFLAIEEWTLILSSTALLLVPIIYLFYSNVKYTKSLSRVLSFFWTIVEDHFLVIITAAWLIGIGPPYALLMIWRFMVGIYVKIRYGGMAGLIEPLDAIGTIDNEHSRQIIKALKTFHGTLDIDKLQNYCLNSVNRMNYSNGKLLYPKFFQHLRNIGGFYCWVSEEKFNIKDHVRVLEGIPMDRSISESEALKALSKIANDDFPEGKSPWEILLIPKFHYDFENPNSTETETKFGMIIRIHHAIGDGYSLLKFILKEMAGESGEGVGLNGGGPSGSKKGKMPIWKAIIIFIYFMYKSPRAFYRTVLNSDNNELHKTGLKVNGKKILVWSEPLKLEHLKAVKDKLEIGMSTLLLSGLVGSLRKYFKEEFGRYPSPNTLSAMIPMPAPNHPNHKMTNKFSVVRFALPCSEDNYHTAGSGDCSKSKSSSPTECNLICKHVTDIGKVISRSPDAPLNLFLMNLAGIMPIWFNRVFLTNNRCTCIISNLPGPGKKLKIWGNEMIDTMFWLPSLGDSGFSVSFLSYKTHLRIGLSIDCGIIKDADAGAQRILNGMKETLIQISKEANLPTDNIYEQPIEVPLPSPPRLAFNRCSLTDSNHSSSSISSSESEEDLIEDRHGNDLSSGYWTPGASAVVVSGGSNSGSCSSWINHGRPYLKDNWKGRSFNSLNSVILQKKQANLLHTSASGSNLYAELTDPAGLIRSSSCSLRF